MTRVKLPAILPIALRRNGFILFLGALIQNRQINVCIYTNVVLSRILNWSLFLSFILKVILGLMKLVEKTHLLINDC